MPSRMDHIVLNVDNDEDMLSFYTDILALPAERLEAYRRGEVPFPSVRLNRNTVIDLFPRKMWQKGDQAVSAPGRLNHFCLALSRKDWDALMKRLESSAIPLEEGPVPRWGAHGTGTSIYFRDPEGNLIEARYYDPADAAQKCLLSS